MCAFYRSYATQMMMNVPFQSSHFVVYEYLQRVLNPAHEYDPKSHLFAGGIAGGVAAALTTPLDVCKTALNTQDVRMIQSAHCPAGVNGFLDAVKTVYKIRGPMGFFGGLQARVLFQMPSTAISWSVYELFKYLLSLSERHDSGD